MNWKNKIRKKKGEKKLALNRQASFEAENLPRAPSRYRSELRAPHTDVGDVGGGGVVRKGLPLRRGSKSSFAISQARNENHRSPQRGRRKFLKRWMEAAFSRISEDITTGTIYVVSCYTDRLDRKKGFQSASTRVPTRSEIHFDFHALRDILFVPEVWTITITVSERKPFKDTFRANGVSE